MATYHLNAKFVQRSKGQSAVAKSAYNSHDILKNDNTGARHDYRYKGEVSFSGIFAPNNAPQWAQELAQNREALWSYVEKSEVRKNSCLAKEIEVSLPHELTDQQREYLVKDFVRENFVRRGLIADVAIHAPSKEGDARNHHAHILLTTREIGKENFGKKLRQLDTKPQLLEWRERWAHLTNRHLERYGHQERIDHRTLEAQGINREPTVHVGPTATDFERDGVKTERGDINREIKESNRKRERLKTIKNKIDHAIITPEKRKESSQHKPTSKSVEKTVSKAGQAASKSVGKAAGMVGRLAGGFLKEVDSCLEFFAASSAPREYTPAQLARDSAARREVNARHTAAKKRDETLDRWSEILKERGNEYAALPASDVRHLNPSDLENIKANGDAGVMAIVAARERERRQEQTIGRARERER